MGIIERRYMLIISGLMKRAYTQEFCIKRVQPDFICTIFRSCKCLKTNGQSTVMEVIESSKSFHFVHGLS